MHIVRQQVVYLTIGEVALLLALIHQFLDVIFELVFYRQSASRLPALYRHIAAGAAIVLHWFVDKPHSYL
jgi:hypothetical protein